MYNMTHLIANEPYTRTQVKYERRHYRLVPFCSICDALAPLVHGNLPIDECCAALLQASQMRCQCPDRQHRPLVMHPHAPVGCRGFA